MNVNAAKRSYIETLPKRKWDKISTYSSILLVPTRKKHDSGWRLYSIVGCILQEPVEIAAYCDDMTFNSHGHDFRVDWSHSLNCPHFWGNDVKFVVGLSLSSTSVSLLWGMP